MTLPWKILAAIVLLGGAFGAGWFARSPEVITKIETQVKTVEVEKIITRTVRVTETRPDNSSTVTETTDTTSNTTNTVKDKTNTTQPVAAATVARSKWSLGVAWMPSFRDPTWIPAVGEVGWRAAGPVWVTGGYEFKHNQALIGLRVEW
jgi:hypothetical protein